MILGRLGPSGRPPGAFLARFGALLGEGTVPEAHAEHPKSARQRRRAPGSARETGGPGPYEIFKPSTSQGCMSLGAFHFMPEARWRRFYEAIVTTNLITLNVVNVYSNG